MHLHFAILEICINDLTILLIIFFFSFSSSCWSVFLWFYFFSCVSFFHHVLTPSSYFLSPLHVLVALVFVAHGRTQAEMAHTCRGTINLATAHIDTEDACNIVLSSGGRTYHLKASTEVERQRWVTALELAKAKAIRMMNDQSGKSGKTLMNINVCFFRFSWNRSLQH